MSDAKKLDRDVCLVYQSKEDKCWVAHSMRTDQIGTGDCIVNALADLLRAVKELLELAEEDGSIQVLKDAPAEFQKLAKTAQTLPQEVYEVAHKMVFGQWPENLIADFKPTGKKTPFKAEIEAPMPA